LKRYDRGKEVLVKKYKNRNAENERNDGVVRWEDRTHLRRSIIEALRSKQ